MFKPDQAIRNLKIYYREKVLASSKKKEQDILSKGKKLGKKLTHLKSIDAQKISKEDAKDLANTRSENIRLHDRYSARKRKIESQRTKLELEKLNTPERDYKKLKERLKIIARLEEEILNKKVSPRVDKFKKVFKKDKLAIIKKETKEKIIFQDFKNLKIRIDNLANTQTKTRINKKLSEELARITSYYSILESKTQDLLKKIKNEENEEARENLEDQYNLTMFSLKTLKIFFPNELNADDIYDTKKRNLEISTDHKDTEIAEAQVDLEELIEKEEKDNNNGFWVTNIDKKQQQIKNLRTEKQKLEKELELFEKTWQPKP